MNEQQKTWLLNAAKAMGFEDTRWWKIAYRANALSVYWNPAKDGLALQEMVCKLRIDVKWSRLKDAVMCSYGAVHCVEHIKCHNNDDQQAYAWAAIRVASAIYEGKQK